MRALIFAAPGVAQVVDRDRPVRVEEMTLVAPLVVGLCATDLEMLDGVMPYLAEGLASFPLQAAHEVVGVVHETGSDGPPVGSVVVVDPVVGCGVCAACEEGIETRCQDRYELGLRRGMPGAAAELVAIPTRKLHVVPEGVPPRAAVFVEPGVTAFNAVRRFGDVRGRRAIVFGPGTVGCIAAQLLIDGGAVVEVHDPRGTRSDLVTALGATPVRDFAPDSFDVVIEAMGAPAAVSDAIRSVAPGGSIALLGVQPAPIAQLDVNPLVFKDATMFGVLNGPGLYDALLARFAAGAVTPELLIDESFALNDAVAAFARMRQRGRTRPKVLLEIGTSA